jgi:hypothetical protein
LIEGVTVTTRREIRRPLGPEELAQLKGERPRLHIIQNPGAKLTAEMLDVIGNKVNCMDDRIRQVETKPRQVSGNDWVDTERIPSAAACL